MSIERTGPNLPYEPPPDDRHLWLLPTDVDALLTDRAQRFRANLWRKAPELGAEFDAIAPLYTEAGEQRTKTAAAAAAAKGFELGVATSAAGGGIPAEFHQALRDGASAVTVPIDGIKVTVRLTSHGTGVPVPASGPAWCTLRAVVRRVNGETYTCADVVAADLPRQIRDARWTDTHGRPVHVVGHPVRRRARRPRWRPLGVAAWLLPAGWMAAMCGRVTSPVVALAASIGTATVVAMEGPSGLAMAAPSSPTATREGFVPPRTELISTVSPAPTPKPTTHPGAKSRRPIDVPQAASATPQAFGGPATPSPMVEEPAAPSATPLPTPLVGPTIEDVRPKHVPNRWGHRHGRWAAATDEE